MSLLDNAYEDFIIMNKLIIDDGYGGTTTRYVDGATIQAVMSYDSSTEMKVAQAMGVTSAYTLTVPKNINLDYHTVLKRPANNGAEQKIFRITSNSDENETPATASLNMRQYSVEEWRLPNE